MRIKWFNTQKPLEECLAHGKSQMTFFSSFFFLSDSKFDVNSNCVGEERPEEAETRICQENDNPKDSEKVEKESLQSDAGLEGLQEAAVGPQVSEE